MAGTFPTSPAPSEVYLSEVQPIIESVAQSGKSQNRINAGQFWEVEFQLPEMLRSEMAPIYAFIAKQRGSSFTVTLPNFNAPQGAGGGTPLVVGAHNAGDTTITTDGWPVSTTVLKAADINKFAGHSKVYMAAEDVISDVTGAATITLVNPLVEDLVNNEAITINDVPFTVTAKKSDVLEWRTKAPQLSRFSIKMREKL